MFNCVKRKINVFISSEIKGLVEFRQNLHFLLLETGLVNEVYVFEKTGASTCSCQASYLNEIPRCDLFILIVKNSSGLSSQIKREYDTATMCRKKIMIFFYNDKEEACDFKTLIKSEPTLYGKYDESNNLFELQQLIYNSFIEDVLSNYANSNLYDDNNNKEISNHFQYTIFHNEYIKNLKDNNGLQEFINQTQSYNINNDLLKYLNEFFDIVLCNKKYNDESFKNLKNKIILNYPGELKNILLTKLNSVGFFFRKYKFVNN